MHFLKGGDKCDTDDLVGDTVVVNTDRNWLSAHNQSSTTGVSSRYAAAARKSVESDRVAGSGRNFRDSRNVSRRSYNGGALSGAASDGQSLVVAAVRGNYAAAAKNSELATKDTEIRRLQRLITAMSEEAAVAKSAKTKADAKIDDLKQRLQRLLMV